MSECAKQLANAVPASGVGGVAGSTIGRGDTQRRSTIGKVRELGIVPEACEHAASGVGNDEFESIGAGSIGHESAVWPAAMFEDVVLQLAERAHQACRKPLGRPAARAAFSV